MCAAPVNFLINLLLAIAVFGMAGSIFIMLQAFFLKPKNKDNDKKGTPY
jgi:hypothetical protein